MNTTPADLIMAQDRLEPFRSIAATCDEDDCREIIADCDESPDPEVFGPIREIYLARLRNLEQRERTVEHFERLFDDDK